MMHPNSFRQSSCQAGALRLLGARLAVCAVLALAAVATQAQDDIPEVVRDVLERAQRHQERGEHAAALEAFEEARRLDADLPQIYAGLGAAHVALGDAEAALEEFVAGLAFDPDSRNLLFNAGVMGLRLGRHAEALDWVQRALDGNPRDVELRLLHAALLDRLGRGEEALRALEAADSLAPRNAQIRFRLGNQLQKLGRSEEAVESYREALRLDRSMLRAHYNLGAVLLELGRLDEALEAYEIALAPMDEAFRKGDRPDAAHAPAYANLGAIHTTLRNWSEAKGAYDKTLLLQPGSSQALYNRAFVHYQLGQMAAAREGYEAALAKDPKLPLAYLHLGQIARQDGQCDDAVGRLESGLEHFDTTQRLAALEVMAFCYAELGRPDRAEQAFRGVLESSPEDPELLLGLGRLLRRQRRAEEARQLLEKALVHRSKDLAIELELLALAEAGGEEERQLALAERMLAEHGERDELWRVRWSLALLMLRRGQLQEARAHLAALGSSRAVPEGERPRVAALEAMAAAAEGDLRLARRRLKEAAGGGGAAAAAVLDALEGEGAKAVEALEKRVPTDGPWTAYWTDLGLLSWSLGQAERARPYLSKAVAGGDGNPAVAAALGDLAMRDGQLDRAVELLGRASAACRAGSAPLPEEAGVLRVRLPPREQGLCPWVESTLRRARLQRALDGLGPALRRGSGLAPLRQVASEVIREGGAPAEEKALAFFLRGVSRTASGEAGATADLRSALTAGLPDALEASARLHLGVALARAGEVDGARRALEELRASNEAGAELRRAATLNLAILLDDSTDDGEAALALYEQYLGSGGSRSDVEARARRLREIYR